MRRLLLLTGAVVLVDTMFFSAITPLLPEYAERFDLSKAGAGILSGSYAAGAVLGTLPAGWLAVRAGSRRTLLLGLTLMSVSSVGFAFADSIVVLDVTRFVDGIGGACAWAGAMGWLLTVTPAAQRGTTIGKAMSAALAGVLLGPVLGAVAQSVGPKVPFSVVGVFAALLAVVALRMPAPARTHLAAVDRPYVTAWREARVRLGAWLVMVPALVFGTVEVLAPLALDELGASGLAIGATFLVAAGIEGVAQVFAGRATDRLGRGAPIRLGLTGTLAFLLAVTVPEAAWLLAAIVVAGCVLSGIVNTPAMTLMSDGVEGAGLEHGLGFAIVNLVWGGGQVVGAVAGAALADATSDAVPYLLLAAVCAATLAGLRGRSAALAPSPAAVVREAA
ncbi:MAG TPA: MFS transporter [Gemmatimonadaceae bacterium]|nr:MFS transporter [Gemmatimonadaceae bacterium]